MENNEKEVLFSVSHLKKYFQVGNHATLKAVDDVSFEIYKGETLGMVGESGCGKTTCGRTCIGLYDKTDGQVLVIVDVLGYTDANFKHNKRYAEVGATMKQAASAYVADVKSGTFPAEANAFKMPAAEREAFLG